ncbi:MAG TPA: hypothetical protein VLF69_02005 [Candidatus Saccharimonadales bacterium]|nr:hypothetical protein [Candidatus Saccharimonadales bacterium]
MAEKVTTPPHHRDLGDWIRHPLTRGLVAVAAADWVGHEIVQRWHHADAARHAVIGWDTLAMAPITFGIAAVTRAVMRRFGAEPETIKKWLPRIALPLGAIATKGAEHHAGLDPMHGGVPGIDIGEIGILAADGIVGAEAASFGLRRWRRGHTAEPAPSAEVPEEAPPAVAHASVPTAP